MIKIFVDKNPHEVCGEEDMDVTFADENSAKTFINVLNTMLEEDGSSIISRGNEEWLGYFEDHVNDFTLEHYLSAENFLIVVNFLEAIYDVSIEIEEESLIQAQEDTK